MDVHSVQPPAPQSIGCAAPQRPMVLVARRVERDRRRDAYLATVAHEMRNALAPLSCAIDVLSLRARGNGADGDMLPIARRQIAQLRTLTDDLLDVGRAMNDEFQLVLATEQLQPILQSAVTSWRVLADLKHQVISLEVPLDNLPVSVDRMRLSQALQNVIGNAVKFTPEGGCIAVSAEADGANALIRVTDSGIGVAADDLGKIFSLFYRAGEQAAGSGGCGIGLALARHILEAHRGSITAGSDGAGKGTTFSITLPLALAAEAA